MPKALCYFGIAVAALVFSVFGLDLVTAMMLDSGFPFRGANTWVDLCLVVCSAILGYLSWATMREQV